MPMSDESMILTVERMQVELRRAMEDIQLLTLELQKRCNVDSVVPLSTASVDPVPTPSTTKVVKRKIKVKTAVIKSLEPLVKKTTAIAPWNAYVSNIRRSMQEQGDVELKNDVVRAKAKASKDSDPEGYKKFCDEWLASQTTES
jgi:hypothetical protein